MIKCKTTNGNVKDKPARISGRRSSKPLMEKRRRARINTCLEILKSYVLKETTENLKQTKQTTANNTKATTDDAIVTTENIEQFLISELKDNKKSILKNSNLANKGRRNPNKLEKADILELTVDYVRRLHEQRDRLQLENCSNNINTSKSQDYYVNTNNSNDRDVSLTLQIEQLIRIPANINNSVDSPKQTSTTTTTTNLSTTTTTNYLMQRSSNGPLLPLSVRTTPSQVPPSPPSSASGSPPLSGQHCISSTTDDDFYYEQPLSMVVCDNSRLRERQPRPWRPWDVKLN